MIAVLIRFNAALDIATRVAAAVSAGAVLFACVAITWAVLARGLVGMNTIWELEAGVYLLIYAAFLSAAYTHRMGGQIAVGFLRNRLPDGARRVHGGVMDAIALALFALILVSGWDMFWKAWETGWRSETLWGPPLWIPYLALPLGAALIVLSLTVDILLRLAGQELPRDAAEES